jgi:HAMP domain-containing protein
MLSRLRWQLTVSHLAAIAVTLVSLIAAAVVVLGSWWAAQHAPEWAPAQAAQLVAQSAGRLIRSGSTDDIDRLLRAFATGNLQTVAQYGPSGDYTPANSDVLPGHVAYIVAVDRDGRVLGSSDPSGVAFAPPERQEWTSLVGQALDGVRGDLMVARRGAGSAALGAAPVLDDRGRASAAVVVATTAVTGQQDGPLWQLVAVLGIATLVGLAGSSVFAIASSSLVGYLLARRLVRRIERLGCAAEAFADGDLSRRVGEASDDELGRLARRFNSMADRLGETLTELEGAKHRAEAALVAKRELVANVSHELRTPLASIRGHTESLLMREDNDLPTAARRDYIDVIYRQTEQLNRLIDDLFLLSTTECGALPLTLLPVALDEVVADVANSLDGAAVRSARSAWWPR